MLLKWVSGPHASLMTSHDDVRFALASIEYEYVYKDFNKAFVQHFLVILRICKGYGALVVNRWRCGWQKESTARRTCLVIDMCSTSFLRQTRKSKLSRKWRCIFSEDLIFHECTSGFAKHIFRIWLPNYDVHRPTDAAGNEMLLSPHQFGWPLFRPRLYSVLSKRSSVTISAFGETLSLLFRKCMIPVSSLFHRTVTVISWSDIGVKPFNLQLHCLC